MKTLEQYKKYRKFLNEGEVTINSFNLEYLQSELKSNNVPKEQIIKRLSKYTFMLDQRQLLVSNIKSYYVACDKVKSQIVLKYSPNLEDEQKYLSIRMLDYKIINISEESEENIDRNALILWK